MTEKEIKEALEDILQTFGNRVFPDDITKLLPQGMLWMETRNDIVALMEKLS